MEMALRGVEGALATQLRPSGASGRSTAPRLMLTNPQKIDIEIFSVIICLYLFG